MAQINHQPAENAEIQASLREELAEEQWFDLLPIEKKLIGYSLALGIVLLIIFIGIFVL